MSLRWKMALGFGGILAIIVVIGFHSISRITSLGQSIDVIIRENYRSVVACQVMKESIERMDCGAVFVLLGADEKGLAQIAENESRFEDELEAELNNITIPGEGDSANRLAALFQQYRSKLKPLGSPNLESESRRRIYFDELHPLFEQIKESVEEILQMNQANMVAMDMRARGQASQVRRQMYGMLAASTTAGVILLFLTSRWILRPITRLTHSASEIRNGNLDLALPGGSRDEIGHLSDAFNEMAASLREFHRSGQTKLMRIQRATQRAFESLPVAVAVMNPSGEVEVSTAAARETFGLRPGVLVRDLPYQWMSSLCDEALTNGRVVELKGEEKIIQQFVGNEERFFRPKAVPILDFGRDPTGVSLILQDVTQQRQQDEMKSGVISIVSHQLKTPLTSVRMAVHLLLEEKIGELTPKQEDLLVAAREDADRLNTIVEDLLDIGRMESGKIRMDLRVTSPIALVEQSVEAFLTAARDQGVTLNLELPELLPDVWADPGRMHHVFANLLSNALKFTGAGGTITVSATAQPEVVELKVADSGVGIPERYLPRIFEQFFRVPGQESGGGAGLGLAIVREIVEAHGGTVRVESHEGKGSTFVFSLRRTDHSTEDIQK